MISGFGLLDLIRGLLFLVAFIKTGAAETNGWNTRLTLDRSGRATFGFAFSF